MITDNILIDELKIRLQKYRSTLLQLKQVNEELTAANKKLTKSEALKSHFISHIANEIINPFTVISSTSQTLIDIDVCDLQIVKKLGGFINQEASYLDFQFKNIFAAAEIESGKAKPLFSKRNIIDLLKTIIEKYNYQAQRKNITINFKNLTKKEKLIIVTDNEKCSLIICNLIHNAIKYSLNDSKIEVTLSELNTQVSISVKDYGEGISKEKQQIIFDRFSQNLSFDTMKKGAGLGLSICKFYAEMLNSNLLYESIKDAGSEFILLISENTDNITTTSVDDNTTFFDDFEMF